MGKSRRNCLSDQIVSRIDIYVMWNTSGANYSHITLIMWTLADQREAIFHIIGVDEPPVRCPKQTPGDALTQIDRMLADGFQVQEGAL